MFDPTSGLVNKGSGCKMFNDVHVFTFSDCLISCPGLSWHFLHRGFGRFLNFVASLSKSSCWKVPDIPRSMEPPFLSRFVPGVPTGCLE